MNASATWREEREREREMIIQDITSTKVLLSVGDGQRRGLVDQLATW